MYVCGMTVYDYCHLGHARVMVVFDMVIAGCAPGEVTYVRNITDIDDKIIKRAVENGESIRSSPTASSPSCTRMPMRSASCADHEPRATEFVPEMLDIAARGTGSGLPGGETATLTTRCVKFAGYAPVRQVARGPRAGERVEVDSARRIRSISSVEGPGRTSRHAVALGERGRAGTLSVRR